MSRPSTAPLPGLGFDLAAGTPGVLPGDVLQVGTAGAAIFSADGTRRRWLSRHLSGGSRRCGFVMLNPSQAGADQPDPTVTRCVGFAKREECSSLEVANMSDIIETESDKLDEIARRGGLTDGNSRHYLKHVLHCDLVIVAWGAHPWARGKLHLWWMQEMGGELPSIFKCLGKTKDGAPRHPLYIKADQPLLPWP